MRKAGYLLSVLVEQHCNDGIVLLLRFSLDSCQNVFAAFPCHRADRVLNLRGHHRPKHVQIERRELARLASSKPLV